MLLLIMFYSRHVETCRESSWPRGCDFPKGLDVVVNLKLYIIGDLANNELDERVDEPWGQ